MDNSKIRIESDGYTAEVYLNGEKVRCTNLTFQGNVDDGIHIKWDGTMQKLDEKGEVCVENHEVVTEQFHYDSHEAVVE